MHCAARTAAPDAIAADARGINELVDGLVRLTAIGVANTLTILPGTREAVARARARYREKRRTAVFLGAALRITWSPRITESAA